jgi:uncharacterized protein YbjT (DUF2867 family)
VFIVMGATGHVGSAVAACLLAQGQPVTVVTRDAKRAAAWAQRGAQVAVADLQDVDRLRSVFRTGRRAFVLNPPAPVATDTDLQERRTAFQVLVALEGSGLEKVVALSTYGAQPGQYLGDLSTLHAFEQGLRHQRIPLAIVRAAYLFTNWDAWWPIVARTGTLRTLYPVDMCFPMVDPIDLGREVVNQLLGDDSGMCHVEGPQPYSPRDVAQAFACLRGRPVQVQEVPRERWESEFRSLGFGAVAARSYARMTAISVDGLYDKPEAPRRGSITLEEHLARCASPPGA